MKVYDKQYIGGKWVTGSSDITLTNKNPLTGEVLYTYQSADAKDVDAAYQAAREAQKEWKKFLPEQKQQVLENALKKYLTMEEEINAVLLEEGGSTLAKRDFEYHTVASIFKLAMKFPDMMTGKIIPSNIPGKDNYIVRIPKGVITVIAPWNVPLVLAARSVIPAIAAGNGVVLKPASDTPASAMLLAEAFEGSGIPDGLFNVVMGAGSQIGDAIVEHPVSDLISFTGSTEVGHHIGETAGRNLKEVSLELGGNNAMIVTEDADLNAAAAAVIFGAFFHQGQVCMALNRIIVMDSVYEEFTKILVEKVKAVKTGDPSDPEVFVGPIINESQVEKIRRLLDETIACGANVALEGSFDGLLVTPWVLTEVTNDMPAASEEVFGPVVCVLRAQSEEEAIAMANDTQYGLSGSVFCGDLYHGMEIAEQMETGMVHVNDQSINDEPQVMFGGVKNSGIGRFNDEWVLEKFTTDRWISVQREKRF